MEWFTTSPAFRSDSPLSCRKQQLESVGPRQNRGKWLAYRRVLATALRRTLRMEKTGKLRTKIIPADAGRGAGAGNGVGLGSGSGQWTRDRVRARRAGAGSNVGFVTATAPGSVPATGSVTRSRSRARAREKKAGNFRSRPFTSTPWTLRQLLDLVVLLDVRDRRVQQRLNQEGIVHAT
jgi:hypothetical protein